MKNFIYLFVLFFAITPATYAQDWVAYNPYIQPQHQVQTVYIQQPQPVVVYQWVPYVVQQNVILEQRRLFCVNQTVVARPTVQWILQPIVVYR